MGELTTVETTGGVVFRLTAYLRRRHFAATKRVADIVLGSIALVLSLPILAVCGLIIKLSSKGPVFYSQIRVGKDGKLFRMYKLRTMYVDAESTTGVVWALHNDPRTVPGSRWMRRSHLDELPQLINVIYGEMSLVGPRPERPEIIAELEKVYPDFRKRLAVRPGITGLAQVRNGYSGSVAGAGPKLDADLEYIRYRKWGIELLILAATVTKLWDRGAC